MLFLKGYILHSATSACDVRHFRQLQKAALVKALVCLLI